MIKAEYCVTKDTLIPNPFASLLFVKMFVQMVFVSVRICVPVILDGKSLFFGA